MSIHFISGKPGGGKSLYGCRKIIDELLLTKRTIVTNLPLNLAELNSYLQEKYPDRSIDLHQRIRMLDETEIKEFYRYRGRMPKQSDQVYGEWYQSLEPDHNGHLDYKEAPEGSVLYVIDEIHLFFNSREWMKTGKAALYYVSQHRKLGDDLICITQSIGNVDKQFRSVTQDFGYVKNHSKERFGPFKRLPVFSVETYMEPFTGSQKMDGLPVFFRLDVSGIARCYNTAAGVGIMGRSADKNEKQRGIPLVFLGVLLVVLGGALFFIPDLMAGGISWISTPAKSKPPAVRQKNDIQSTVEPKKDIQKVIFSQEETSTNLWITGVMNMGKGPVVYLSNGSKWTGTDGLQYLDSHRAKISNTNYFYR